MTTRKPRTAAHDKPYLVATFANHPGLEIPLLSDAECEARGIQKPTVGLLDHLTPEQRLTVLEPLIDLLVEQVVRDLRDAAPNSGDPAHGVGSTDMLNEHHDEIDPATH